MRILEAVSLGKAFGRTTVLHSASFTVRAGEIVFVAGGHGSGKTTLLRICAGLLAPDSGAVRHLGRQTLRRSLYSLARDGLWFQPLEPLLWKRFTLREHLAALPFPLEPAQGEALNELGVDTLMDVHVGSLPPGEQRWLAVALAIAREPRCLLLDEPLTDATPDQERRLGTSLKSLALRGCGILVTGCEAGSLMELASHVVWLSAGTTRSFESPDAARADANFSRDFLGSLPSIRPTSRHLEIASNSAGPVVGLGEGRAVQTASEQNGPVRDRMVIDRQTLADLEIFAGKAGGRSVFDRLDRTRTAGGRQLLRQRFAHPAASSTLLERFQAELRFGLREPAVLRKIPDGSQISDFEAYRDSNHAISFSSGLRAAWSGAWMALRDPGRYAQIRNGLTATAALLRTARAIVDALRTVDPPSGIAGIADDLGALLDLPRMRIVSGNADADAPWHRLIGLDRLVRADLRDELSAVLSNIYALDCIASLALATAELGYSIPRFTRGDHPLVHIKDVVHPLVERPVANDFDLERGRCLFVTGPNMAGKTTYITACAVAVYLAHVGMGVPASAMELTPFDALFSSLVVTGNVSQGVSFFLAEIRRVKAAAQLIARGTRVFAVLDEMFKGTNVKDAVDATHAVVTGMGGYYNGLFLVSSHLSELAADLEASGTARLVCFEAHVDTDGPRFGYQLKEGASAQRLGMLLLEREAVLDLLAGRTKQG